MNNSNNVTEFKERLTELLKARNTGEHSCSSPNYPVCVMYFGANSAVYHDYISENLTIGGGGWGGSANQIPYYILEANGLKNMSGDSHNTAAFGDDMTELLKSSNTFANPSGISLYCVLDTDSVSDENTAEDFNRWYFAVDDIKKMINTPLQTMLLIVLNDEFNHQKKSVEIKQKLCEIYQSQNKTHLYGSVFVLGRRLRNGSYADSNSSSSGDLLSNIILLSNTVYVPNTILYKSDKPALTVAYASSAKPVGDIAIITLKAITAKLSQMLNYDRSDKAKNSKQNCLTKVLEIDKGRSELYERIFAEISEHLPSNDYLNYLPAEKQSVPDFSKSYTHVDKESYGCLTAFLEKNYFSLIDERMSHIKSDIVSQLTFKICEQLTAGQLCEGVDEWVISSVLSKAGGVFNSDGKLELNVLDAIKLKLKTSVANHMQGIIRETVIGLSQHAKICTDGFYRIKKSVDMLPVAREIGTGMHLVKFYTDKANRFLNMENSAEIFKKVFQLHNKEEDIFEALFSAMESCFQSDKVYRYSYIDEMYERLGINDIHIATNQIIGELIESLDEKIRFYSATVFPNNRTFEAYFLNTSPSAATAEHVGENGLYQRLKNRELPPNTQRTFLNTHSNDTVESMWFYECRENDLLANI